MLKTFIRPAMICIPFLIGWFFPQLAVLNAEPFNFVRIALMIIFFMSCLQIRMADLPIRRYHWYLLLSNLAMGLVPYFLLKLFLPQNPVLAEVAFFVGITPTATAAPVVIAFLHGRIGFALTGFTITNVFISLALLFLLPMVTGDVSFDFIYQVGKTIALVIAVPFAAAALVKILYPQAAMWPKHCKTFSFSLWSFTLMVIAAIAHRHFIENPDESKLQILGVAVVSLVLCIGNFYFGKYLSPKRFRRETSQLLGQKNTTFTMYLALTYAGPLVAMGPIFYVLWHNTWNAYQMYQYDCRTFQRIQRREHPDAGELH